MITYTLLDSTATTDNTDPSPEIQVYDKHCVCTYNVSGGTSTNITLKIYGQLKPDNDTATFSASEWIELASVTGVRTGFKGDITVSDTWPRMVAQMTGNSGSSRVRVELGVNEG